MLSFIGTRLKRVGTCQAKHLGHLWTRYTSPYSPHLFIMRTECLHHSVPVLCTCIGSTSRVHCIILASLSLVRLFDCANDQDRRGCPRARRTRLACLLVIYQHAEVQLLISLNAAALILDMLTPSWIRCFYFEIIVSQEFHWNGLLYKEIDKFHRERSIMQIL